ncbi:hypothetical protein LSAT2_020612 [Lamellibrachia satsuma]|nr:hypothetical protein LSAT2_020612 [Lamellibrachia satsuma]
MSFSFEKMSGATRARFGTMYRVPTATTKGWSMAMPVALHAVQRMLPVTSQWLEWSSEHSGWNALTTKTSDHVTLITGKQNTLKTSLLFQAAVSYASEGCHVTFISQQPFSCLPWAVHGMPRPNPVIMKRLKMLYLTNYDDLIGYLTTLHQGAMIPSVLVLDDLHLFLHSQNCQDGKQQLAVAKLCSLLVDTAHYLHSSSDTTSGVLISLQDAATAEPIMATVERVFKTRWHIHTGESSHIVANTNEYVLQAVHRTCAQVDCRLLLTFSSDRAEIRLKQISVEDIQDKS